MALSEMGNSGGFKRLMDYPRFAGTGEREFHLQRPREMTGPNRPFNSISRFVELADVAERPGHSFAIMIS
jgi:hypothetical protein